jgi:acyl-CoA synthetase (AMP-forming)/AMP-acid ligase II/acyl carrier protein
LSHRAAASGPVDAATLTLPARLASHATTRGELPAFHVVAGDSVTTISWAGLLRQSCAYADRYRAAGVVPGDAVLISLKHGPSMYPAYLGAMLLGATPSLLPFPNMKQDPVLYWEAQHALFARVQARAMLTYAEHAAQLAGALPAVTRLLIDEPLPLSEATPIAELAASIRIPDPDSVMLLQHSSGTTGLRKGVALSYRHVAEHAVSYSAALGLTAESRIASWMPLYHDGGLVSAFLMPGQLGATVVSIDAFEWVLAPHLLLELMDTYRCDYTWLPNFAFNHLVRTKQGGERYDLGHVRAFVGTAEPCKPQTFDDFVETFAPHGVRIEQLQTMYGMAECVLATSQSPVGVPLRRVWLDAQALHAGRAVVREQGPGTVEYLSNGPLIEGLECRIDPDADSGVDEGTPIGELQLRGDFVFTGYDRADDATAEVFVDGWYRTGDLCCLIDGDVYVLGRSKDVIIHHGVNYYAHDLEAAASTVAGVKPGRCAAVAVYDEAAGSEAIELIAEREVPSAVSDAQLRIDLKQAIAARFQVMVARVHLVEPGWLVKTTSGKVSRRENLAKLQRQPPAAEPAEPAEPNDLWKLVVDTIASTFSVAGSSIGAQTTAADVEGWDSLGHTVLMIRLGKALGSALPEHVAAGAGSVGELVDLLAGHLGARR